MTFEPFKDAFLSSWKRRPKGGLDMMQGNVSVEGRQKFPIYTHSNIDFSCDLPLKWCTETSLNDPKSAICAALRTRIVELSKFGIYNIWMRADGGSDSPFHIASVLGFSIDDWNILAPHSGLFDKCNTIKKELWGCKLQMEIDFRYNKFKMRS